MQDKVLCMFCFVVCVCVDAGTQASFSYWDVS